MRTQTRNKLLKVRADYPHINLAVTRNALSEEGLKIIKEKLRRFCEAIPGDLTAHERALLLYRVVTECVRYDRNPLDEDLRYTYAAAMLTGSAVCMGISELLYILYNACGIESCVVVGCITGSKDYHAWLQVKLPDACGNMVSYHCDPTWDLRESSGGSFQFYLRSDSFMEESQHNWLAERYDPCPRNCDIQPYLSPQLVLQMCREFEKMYSPNRKDYTG